MIRDKLKKMGRYVKERVSEANRQYEERERAARENADKTIDELVALVKKYQMEAAVVLLAESVKPLTYMGSQLILRGFGYPFLVAILGEEGISKYAVILEDRELYERFIRKLEESATNG
jgi:hypothetical protein